MNSRINWINSRASVCEFTGLCEKFGVSTPIFTVKSRDFHLMTRASETVPVLTRVKLVQNYYCGYVYIVVNYTTGRTHACIHGNTMKTHENTSGGAVPILNHPANKEPFLNQLAHVILVHNWYHSTSTCVHVYSREYTCSACCHEF